MADHTDFWIAPFQRARIVKTNDCPWLPISATQLPHFGSHAPRCARRRASYSREMNATSPLTSSASTGKLGGTPGAISRKLEVFKVWNTKRLTIAICIGSAIGAFVGVVVACWIVG